MQPDCGQPHAYAGLAAATADGTETGEWSS